MPVRADYYMAKLPDEIDPVNAQPLRASLPPELAIQSQEVPESQEEADGKGARAGPSCHGPLDAWLHGKGWISACIGPG